MNEKYIFLQIKADSRLNLCFSKIRVSNRLEGKSRLKLQENATSIGKHKAIIFFFFRTFQVLTDGSRLSVSVSKHWTDPFEIKMLSNYIL